MSTERALILLIVIAALVAGGLALWWWRRAGARPRLRRRRFVPERAPATRSCSSMVSSMSWWSARCATPTTGRRAGGPAASAITVRAAELVTLVNASESKCVNIIAHSMGGLDARYAVSCLDLVGALVTVGRRIGGHRWRISRAASWSGSGSRRLSVAAASIDALRDLTSESLARFKEEVPDAREVA